MKRYHSKVKVILSGGGTSGSVTPLLAMADELNRKNFDFLWVGTRKGPERNMVAQENIPFKTIISVKLNRYLSFYTILYTLLSPVFFIIACIQAFVIILKFNPQWIATAGSFSSVPMTWIGFVLGKKIIIHQQDIRPGLANKLMAPFADNITVAFQKSLQDYGHKAEWIGNPVRSKFINQITKSNNTQANNELPLIFIFGGGTGAQSINNLVIASLDNLTKFCRIIHVVGKTRTSTITKNYTNYQQYDFLNYNQMIMAYKQASLVVARAGMSTITELAYLGKPAIIIPMPQTHQEDNAEFLKNKSAACVMDQNSLNSKTFVNNIKKILNDKKLQEKYNYNISHIFPKNSEKKLANILQKAN